MYGRLNAPRHFGNDNRNYLPSSVFMEQTPYEISAHGSSRLHPTALFNSKMMIRSSSGWDKDLYNCQSYQRSFCSPNLTGHAKFDAETLGWVMALFLEKNTQIYMRYLLKNFRQWQAWGFLEKMAGSGNFLGEDIFFIVNWGKPQLLSTRPQL
ncbi:uncharacterized protein LOC114398719 [Glycine soja]|uniref:uncharacterized protein LOC114398719 n=1 Tax=Glycine soja TaxID=3848 RepID=UPI00103F9A48|nr:uncharacterized protein LOC114398719 [Glycine soja]